MVKVAGVFTHKAEFTQPEIPDVYPNQTAFCLPLSRLGISKKVISSAQSWLSAAPGSFFFFFFSLQLSNYIQAFSTRRLESMTLNPEAVIQRTTTNVR